MSESQILSPPASQPGPEVSEGKSKPERGSSELRQSLDTLLEQYLHLLDRQQQLQLGFGKQLSSVQSILLENSCLIGQCADLE